MIYMKSTSGNDGSYNLTVSFAVGTNPDTATVNVNNRVQTALPQLPQAVQVQGLTVIKRPAALLQFMNLYSETGKLSPVYITSYATINVLDALPRVPVGRGRASPGAERAGAGRPPRRAAGVGRPAVPAQRADPGNPDDARAV